MAISLRSHIKGKKRNDRSVIIRKPDLDETESFSLDDLAYTKHRDYFKSGINVCMEEGLIFSNGLNDEELKLMEGTIRNRDLLKQALWELEKDEPNHERIGDLLTEHHSVLHDVPEVSTPKIEAMLDAALNAGALGGKINGSGGGGCMFSYSPNGAEKVAAAIERVGGKAYIVHPDVGTRTVCV